MCYIKLYIKKIYIKSLKNLKILLKNYCVNVKKRNFKKLKTELN